MTRTPKAELQEMYALARTAARKKRCLLLKIRGLRAQKYQDWKGSGQ